jgi:hypothetical protein
VSDDGVDYDWDASVGYVLDNPDDHDPASCSLDVSICPFCGPLVDRGDPELEAELDELFEAQHDDAEPEVGA